MFEQRIIDNDDERFPGQTLIIGFTDDVEVWRSWAPPSIDAAVRLNVDLATAADDRSDTKTTEIAYRVPTVAEAAALAIDADQHRVVATYACCAIGYPVADAATACDLPEQALIDEAIAWAIASGA